MNPLLNSHNARKEIQNTFSLDKFDVQTGELAQDFLISDENNQNFQNENTFHEVIKYFIWLNYIYFHEPIKKINRLNMICFDKLKIILITVVNHFSNFFQNNINQKNLITIVLHKNETDLNYIQTNCSNQFELTKRSFQPLLKHDQKSVLLYR